MKLIVAAILVLLIWLCEAARDREPELSPRRRRWLAFLLVGTGAMLWASVFDAVHNSDVSGPLGGAIYRNLVIRCTVGLALSIIGILVSIFQRGRLLRAIAVLVGALVSIGCAAALMP